MGDWIVRNADYESPRNCVGSPRIRIPIVRICVHRGGWADILHRREGQSAVTASAAAPAGV